LEGLAAAQVTATDPELGDLLEEYGSELERAKLADWPGVLRAAIAAAPQLERPAALLLPDVPIRSSSEVRFVETIGCHAAAILATLPKGDEGSATQLRETLWLGSSRVSRSAHRRRRGHEVRRLAATERRVRNAVRY